MKEGTNTGRCAGLLLLCALLGGITGAAAMKLVEPDPRADAQGSVTDGAMTSVLQSLTAETAALREALSRAGSVPAVARDAALREPTPLSTAPDLLAALERLTALTAQLLEQQGAGGPLQAQATTDEQRQRMEALLGDRKQWGSQMLWSSQRILDVYGRPSLIHINDNGSERWIYDREPAGTATFTVHSGRVTASYLTDGN